MAIKTHIQHIKSAELEEGGDIKKPVAENFQDGEIIINYNEAAPTLFIRDSGGNVVEFRTHDVAESLVNALKGGNLPSAVGYRTVKEIADTLHTFLTSTTDADTTINKWKELEAFLNGIPDSGNTLIAMMNSKVDKTTTVAGKPLSGNITLVKGDVGLGNVDNTSDTNKPVSTAQAAAIADAKKAGTDAQSNLNAHKSNTSNPHSVTKAQVGLGNVDNTADLDKPISHAQAAAINTKLDKAGGTIANDLTVGKTLQANLIKSVTDVIAYAGSDAEASGMILDDLSDVDTSGKENGYVLTYNGTSAKWEAKEARGGGGLVEVSFSDIKGSPSDNDSLRNSLATKVESATLGGSPVTKSGNTLQLPAYPTTLPASDVSAWAKASSLAVASVPNLPSSKITTMTGYTKASAAAAISASDSLNVAIGKLEKALDGKQASGNYEPAFSKNTAFNKNFGSSAGTVCQGNDSRLSNARPASDVYAWAKAATKPSYSYSEITGSIDGGTY